MMLRSILTLVRWHNLLIVGGIQAIVFYTLFDSGLSRMSWPYVLLLILITLCITAGGNVINDYHDSEIDAVNRPGNWVAGNTMTKPAVLWVYRVCILFGAVGAVFFAVRMGMVRYLPVFPLAVVGLQLYSTHLKCKPVIGNALVAMYCGAVVLIMAIPDMVLDNAEVIRPQFWYYILFAFLITFYREIIKDIEDYTGDHQFACQTFVVRYGLKAGKVMASAAGLVALTSLLFWDNAQAKSSVSLGILVLEGAIVGSLALIWYAKDPGYYHKASTLIKLVMVGGTLLLFLQY